MTIISILAALFFSGVVFAEGEVPPVTPEESPIAVEEPVILEAAPPPAADAPAPEEPAGSDPMELPVGEISAEIPIDETGVIPEDPAIEAAPVDLEAEPEVIVLDQTIEEDPRLMSAEPEIVLVDPTGEALDMASQASAEMITSADPYFTVGLITYRFSNELVFCTSGDPYCFDGNTDDPVIGNAIQFAIDYIVSLGVTPTNGMIYVQKATYAETININAGISPVLSTLKGLIGEPDTAGVYPTIDGDVSITGTTLGFTLSGFTINGSVTFNNNIGTLSLADLDVSKPTGGGINITGQKGNVVLTNVRSSHNLNTGARIVNTLGGNVTITNSAFDDNGVGSSSFTQGLRISTNGIVTINGISASRNRDTQVDISGFSNLSIRNAVINGPDNGNGVYLLTSKAAPVVINNLSANYNAWYGIYINTAGSITLTAVDALYNQTGIYIDNQSGIGTVTLNTITASNNNNMNGLTILSKGAITLTSVKADNNTGGYGAYLDNSTGTGSVTVTSLAASGGAGANSFSNNISNIGLWINSSGVVMVTNTKAGSNGREGLLITNTTGTVTINKNLANWTNNFSGNVRQGIKITTQGIVYISSSIASNNQWTGIEVTGKGAITLTDVEAFNNGLAGGGVEYSGLKLTNTNGTGGVTIKSSAAANYFDFSDNYTYGISIISYGAVSVGNVIVNDTINKYGLNIDNRTASTLTAPAVTISNSSYDLNNWSGVRVVSDGSITLTNVSSTNSQVAGNSGVTLSNITGTASGVAIRSSSPSMFYEYSKNTCMGIEIYSNGAVAVSNVIAEGNGSDGIFILNNGAGDQPVSVSGSTANGNTQDGIEIYTKGTVTLTNTGASENINGFGATISNWEGIAFTGVTIRSTLTTKYYDFSNNKKDGIFIWSNGAISISNANALENDEYGLNIKRSDPGSTGAVSITRGTFDHNTFGGVQVLTTPGVITLTDVTASNNDPTIGGNEYSGVYINATYTTAFGGSVTITSSLSAKFYDFSNNTKNGLEIYSSGPVSVSNVVAEGNQETNINIENQFVIDASPKPVSVNLSTANHSVSGDGIYIITKGSVTLNTLTANENLSGNGLYVDAVSDSLTPAAVTMIGARNEFSTNGINGIYIETEGNISLTNIIADENSGFGIHLNSAVDNYSTGNVTINASSNFWNSSSGNDVTGLYINTLGTVTISRMHSNDNGNSGISIDNVPYNILLPKNVTLTSVDANRNRGEPGLYINSLGTVALNSTRADSNEQNGLIIYTNRAIILNGVSASYNSTHEANLPTGSTGIHATINERLTLDAEGDIWHFVGDNTISYTITLESKDFDAYMKLFHWNSTNEEWELVTEDDNSYDGIDDAQILRGSGPAGLVTNDLYYVLATTAGQWGEPGDYVLNFNGPGIPPAYEYIGATIDNHLGTGSVTITSPASFWSAFNENNYSGLIINTNGSVSITNTDARDNAADGLYVREYYNPTSVTIRNTLTTRIMSFSNNGNDGIRVPSAYGAITISGLISASDNRWYGAYLRNNGVSDSTPMLVTITSLTANDNGGAGIDVISKGNITLSNITANKNRDAANGVVVDNYFSSLTVKGNVTINGSNVISGNLGNGLAVNTGGILSISGVRAENNLKSGLVLNAHTAGKSVTLSNIIAQYNDINGVSLTALGTTTLTNVRSCVNGTASSGGEGIYINTGNAYHIYINNSIAIGNVGGGIRVESQKSWLHLVGTFYYGNNTDNTNDEPDLKYLP